MDYKETQEAIAKLKLLLDGDMPTTKQAIELTEGLRACDTLPLTLSDKTYVNRNYALCIPAIAIFSATKKGTKTAVRTSAAGTKIYGLNDKLIERLLKFYKV